MIKVLKIVRGRWIVVELRAFKTLYQWIVAYDCLHISNSLVFLSFSG